MEQDGAYRLLLQQSVLHDVLSRAWHLRACSDVEAFVLQVPGLHVLGKLLIRRHWTVRKENTAALAPTQRFQLRLGELKPSPEISRPFLETARFPNGRREAELRSMWLLGPSRCRMMNYSIPKWPAWQTARSMSCESQDQLGCSLGGSVWGGHPFQLSCSGGMTMSISLGSWKDSVR